MSGSITRQPLKQAIQNEFQGESLSARQLASLNAQLGARPKPQRWRSFRATAAALVFAVGALTAVLTLRLADPAPTLNPPQRIAQDVASNHVASAFARSDVTADTIAVLQPAFSRLGFQLIEPPRSSLLHALEGGRFCSILAVPAAQLRYRSAEGELVTLYQAPYDQQVHGVLPEAAQGEAPLLLVSRGVAVRIWTERGLVVATASSSD